MATPISPPIVEQATGDFPFADGLMRCMNFALVASLKNPSETFYVNLKFEMCPDCIIPHPLGFAVENYPDPFTCAIIHNGKFVDVPPGWKGWPADPSVLPPSPGRH